MTNEELLQIIQKAAKDNARELDLSDAGLEFLPPEIGQLNCLYELYLDNNQLTSLPTEIGQLNHLSLLYLSENKLTSLPSSIKNLFNLNELILTNNHLIYLPPEIGNLTNLRALYIDSNHLVDLPTEIRHLKYLTELRLSKNQLTSLPVEIEQLSNLAELDLEMNPLPIPPEVLAEWDEPSTIINYYLKLQAEHKKPLNEAKVLLVGQGSVGKTSLVERLIENRYNPHKRKTEGIKIQNWQISVNDQTIRLNVWDFGGQEIMHATHQFFLTKRSLYLLVLDAREDEKQNRLEDWLKIIQSFGSDSPVIVVGNKIDQHPLDIDQRGLRNKYPNIQNIVAVSCETGKGLETLRATLTKQVGRLENIHDLLPLSWFELKTHLEQMEQDYIPYNDYEHLCQAKQITDSLSQDTLIELLHRLGIVLNFRDEPRLAEMGVLNPEWVTNGVYKILNDNLLMTEYRGILDCTQLNRILDSPRYPPSKQLFIVDMMRRFELCFPLEDGTIERFLIPDLLPKEEPATGNWDNALAFQYHYGVLPSSIISRFIVRMHHLAERRTWWRSGIVLKHRNNRALVKADREDKQMFICVNGSPSTRRELLAMIRSQFDAIHQSIKGLDPKEKVPLPNRPKILVDYEHLLNLEEMGETSFIPEGLKERVTVKQLLDGIEPEQTRQKRQLDRDDEDITEMNRASASSSIINIYNQNMQENQNPMSNIYQNHHGKGDNVAGNKTLNQFNNSPNLAKAARDIKELLDQLSKDYPSNTPAGQAMIGAKAIEHIENNPTLRQRVVNALKEAGATALEEAVDHPAVKILVAGAKGLIDA